MYTDEGEIEKYLGVDISGITTWVEGVIASVKSVIDNYCGKAFEAAAETRYYDGEGGTRLRVDSFIGSPTVKTLELDGDIDQTLTEGQGDDFITYPLNTAEKNELVLMPTSSLGYWPHGKRRVQVTANFGYATTVPADVKLAATMLASRIIEKSLKGGELTSVRLGEYSANFKEIDDEMNILGIYSILDKYRDLQL